MVDGGSARICPRSDIVPSQVQLTKHHRANQPVMWESMLLIRKAVRAMRAMLFLDRIKREKGVWWMPWQQEAMKDVIPCVKPWGAGNRL